MSLILCMVTVLTVDWNRSEIKSSPMVVPCTGTDHVIRMELVTVPTHAEYLEFQRVLRTSAARSTENISAESFGESVALFGPRTLGHHYAAALQANRHSLSQNGTVRLISITEKVDYSQYSRVDHLVRQLEHSQPSRSSDPSLKVKTNQSPGKDEADKQYNSESNVGNEKASVTESNPFEGVQYPLSSHLLSRKRRMGDVNVDNHIKTDVRNTRQNEKHASDNQESKTTGGGYGSQTCINSQFTAWNNSTFTSGKCGCECPTCPSCNTATIIAMAEKSDSERSMVQSKLNECQKELSSQSKCSMVSPTNVCDKGEVRRLKEETRNLRARMRRMTSTRTVLEPTPTKSTLVSSLESVGAVLVESAVGYSTNRNRSKTGPKQLMTHPVPNSPASTVTSRVKPTNKTTASRRKRPSKIPVIKGSRTTSRRASSSTSRSKSTSKIRRGRRSLENFRLSLNRFNPWSPHSEDLYQEHFVAAESSKSVRAGNNNFLEMMDPVREYSSPNVQLYNQTFPRRSRFRSRRDTHDSHFTGSSNSADVTAFDHANFKGSTEIRHDHSTNVRDFNPNISPEINIDSSGSNETLVTKSHNENDINIVNAHPCICDDNFNLIMSAVFTQMCLTVILTISIVLHYHIHRCASHKKKKDLALLKMQAHMVYKQNKTPRRSKAPNQLIKETQLQLETTDNRCNQLEFY